MENTAQTQVQEVFNHYDSQPEAPEKTPMQEVIDPTPEPVLYDKTAIQRFTFEDEDSYPFTFVYEPIRDTVIEEYDRLREVLVEADASKTEINTNSIKADNYLFRELCADIEGYDGEKPEGWQDLVDYEDKRAANAKLLGFKIVDETGEKELKKRSWGARPSGKTIELKARFNDEIVLCSATFAKKTPGDVAAYNVIKSRVSLVEKDLDESAIKIPASMKRKGDLFDKLKPETTGYIGDPPLHHKAAFITAFFDSTISSAEKK